MRKWIVTGLCALFLSPLLTAQAFAQELLVGGQAVGIQISTDGVIVAGFCPVETEDGAVNPAEDAGLKAGDLICGADGQSVSDAAGLIAALEEAGDQVELEVRRGSQTLSLPVQTAVGEEGRPMLGILLRDGLNGIGTLTFCDPDSGVFGALGHSINDSETGLAVPLREGSVTEAQIVAVHPGTAGTPGELDGISDLSQVLGSVERNTDVGIFGHISAALYRDADGTHAMFSVTDPALLSRTGGIVQGMSGSPILQNGCLVGAVTHVFINDASRGYAVSIQDMLRAAGIAMDKAA